jgi:hypothetical protein
MLASANDRDPVASRVATIAAGAKRFAREF